MNREPIGMVLNVQSFGACRHGYKLYSTSPSVDSRGLIVVQIISTDLFIQFL